MATRKTKSAPVPRYTLLVEWSDEDQCYVGRAPELMLGGVHGIDRAQVFAELTQAVDEWIADAALHGESLPEALAGKKFSGKFILRTGAALHKQLTLRALHSGDSLNNYVVKHLQRAT